MNKTILAFITIGLILGGVGAAWKFGVFQEQFDPGLCKNTVLVKSASNVEYDSGGDWLIVDVVAGKGNDCLKISLSETELEKSGKDIKKPFNSFIGLKEQTNTWRLSNQSNYVYNIGVEPIGEVWVSSTTLYMSCTIDKCKEVADREHDPGEEYLNNLKNTYYTVLKKSFSRECYCVYPDFYGETANLVSTRVKDFKADISVDNEVKEISGSNLEASFKGGDVEVKYVGGLSGLKQLDPPDYDFVYIFDKRKYHMADDGMITEAKQSYGFAENYLKECLNKRKTSPSTACTDVNYYEDKLENYEGRENTIIINKLRDQRAKYKSENPLVESTRLNGVFEVVSEGISFDQPEFRYKIRGSLIIAEQESEPDLSDCNRDFDVTATEPKTTSFILENEGEPGTILLSMECDGADGSIEQNQVQLGTDESRPIEAVIKGLGGTPDTRYKCTVTARGEGTTNTDTCIIEGTSFEKKNPCTYQGKTFCNDDGSLSYCSAAGVAPTVQLCDFGCERFENTHRCILQANETCNNGVDDDGDGMIDCDDPECTRHRSCKEIKECKLWDIVCHIKGIFKGTGCKWYDFSCQWQRFKIFFGLAAVFIIFFVTLSFGNRGGLGRGTSVTIALITGALAGLFAYYYTIWAIAIAFIYYVIAKFIPMRVMYGGGK